MGSRRRAVRGTAKNDRSSRSHAVFTLELTRTTTRGAATVTQASRLHLVDLAGSERLKAGAENYSDERLREAQELSLIHISEPTRPY